MRTNEYGKWQEIIAITMDADDPAGPWAKPIGREFQDVFSDIGGAEPKESHGRIERAERLDKGLVFGRGDNKNNNAFISQYHSRKAKIANKPPKRAGQTADEMG